MKNTVKSKTMTGKTFNSQHIDVYWWNMGRKTKEYSGLIEGYLEYRNITFKEISYRSVKGLHFEIPAGNGHITFQQYGGDNNIMAIKAIQMFLIYMGDPAQIKIGLSTISIN